LGADATNYKSVFEPLAAEWESLSVDVLAPPKWPRHPVMLARFGLSAFQPARRFAERRFSGDRAKALFAGLAAHSMLSLEQWGSGAFGLVLGATAHALGWPIVRGGSQKLTAALVDHLISLGGQIFLRRPVHNLAELPRSRVVLCDVTPRQLVKLAGTLLPSNYRDKLKTTLTEWELLRSIGPFPLR
jgi:phytoene dehydrogenase-like protein